MTTRVGSCGLLRRFGTGAFTFIELLVALSLLAVVSLFILQAFIIGMAHAGRSNERAAATTIALQVMEQIRGSVNPYTWVGFTDLARSNLPLPAPYTGVTNPTPHTFQVAVDLCNDLGCTPPADLSTTMATVKVYRLADPDATPFVQITTLLDDQ